MTELEKIAYAKSFIDKLANGINPLDDSPVAEYDVVNNVRLKKCFSFVSDVLRQVIENGGTAPKAGGKKAPFSLTPEQLSRFKFSDTAITASDIARRINAIIGEDTVQKLSYNSITSWLMSIDMLTVEVDAYGKRKNVPTEAGARVGILMETRTWEQREYQAVVYNRDAQAFIVDSMNAIFAFAAAKTKKKPTFSVTQEQLSRFEFSNLPIPVTEIARRINALVDADAKEKLSYNYITSWLVSIGALAVEFDADGTKHKVPTEYGKRLGISLETRKGEYREYQVVLYNRDAQAFIIDNMNAILSFIGGTTRT